MFAPLVVLPDVFDWPISNPELPVPMGIEYLDVVATFWRVSDHLAPSNPHLRSVADNGRPAVISPDNPRMNDSW